MTCMGFASIISSIISSLFLRVEKEKKDTKE
jgi:hypothetical protein